MQFVWNEIKNNSNQKKHGINFELAKIVFSDPHLLSWIDERFDGYNEERWVGLGSINNLVIIAIVHTFRSNENGEEIIHIISARKATKQEKKTYLRYRISH